MDPHFILDIFTLCAVATLIVILVLIRALKRRKIALAHQTKYTQTHLKPLPSNTTQPEINLTQDLPRVPHLTTI